MLPERFGDFSSFSIQAKRNYWSCRGWVYVIRHVRSSPGMAWTGVKDVPVREYIRRPPYYYRKGDYGLAA